MNSNNEKEIKKYLQSIKNALPVTYRKRAALMKHFSKGVQEYCLEHEEFTMYDIYCEFGTVDEVAEALMNEMSSEYMVRHIKAKKILICALTGIVIVLIAIFIFYNGTVNQPTL